MPIWDGRSYHWTWQSGSFRMDPARSCQLGLNVFHGQQGEWMYSPIHSCNVFIMVRWWWEWDEAGTWTHDPVLTPWPHIQCRSPDSDDENWGAWRAAPYQPSIATRARRFHDVPADFPCGRLLVRPRCSARSKLASSCLILISLGIDGLLLQKNVFCCYCMFTSASHVSHNAVVVVGSR